MGAPLGFTSYHLKYTLNGWLRWIVFPFRVNSCGINKRIESRSVGTIFLFLAFHTFNYITRTFFFTSTELQGPCWSLSLHWRWLFLIVILQKWRIISLSHFQLYNLDSVSAVSFWLWRVVLLVVRFMLWLLPVFVIFSSRWKLLFLKGKRLLMWFTC